MTISEAQLAERKIGGSDVGTIMGVNPFDQAEALRLRILGRLERDPPGLAAQFGNLIEPSLALMYTAKTGEPLVEVNETLSLPQYPWLTCHIDRKKAARKAGVEFKNVGRNSQRYWGAPGTDQAPDAYLLQGQTYLIVTMWEEWTIVPYFGGVDLQEYEIEPDVELQRMILDQTERFWRVNVLEDVPCPLDFAHSSTPMLLKKMHQLVSDKQIRIADQETLHWVEEWRSQKAKAKLHEKEAHLAENHVLDAMKDAGLAILPDGLKLEHREIHRNGYSVKETHYRTLKLIGEKK